MASNLKPYADLKAKTREYTDKDGKKKSVYIKVGTLFASPHLSHLFIHMESVPVGNNWDGAVSVFKRDDAQQSSEEVTDDDIKKVENNEHLKDVSF